MTNACFAAFPLLLLGTVLIGNYFIWEGLSYMKRSWGDSWMGGQQQAMLTLWQGAVIVLVSLLAMLLALNNRRVLIEKEWKPLGKKTRWVLGVGAGLILVVVLAVIGGTVKYRL